MIHWPDPPFLIAGTLCGFDRDPMQGGATCVAQVTEEWDGATWTTADKTGRVAYFLPPTFDRDGVREDAQRAAEAAIGGEA